MIQHEDDAPPSWWGEWLAAAGVEPVVVLAHRGEPLPADLSEYDGLLVLGGAMGAYDDDRCPWLTPAKKLIAEAAADSKPFLGICLGHQLASVALGGEVVRNPAGTATGLTPVELTDAGVEDPLLGSVAAGDRAVQWNEDIVSTLPPDATVLAVAPDGSIQAARFGPRAWGVQFHPEVSPEVFALWAAASEKSEPAADQTAPDQHAIALAARQITEAEAELRACWRPLAERFAAVVRTASTRAVALPAT